MKRKNMHQPTQSLAVRVLVLCDRNAAVARATLAVVDPSTGEYVMHEDTGSAKRAPGDQRNDMIATNLAAGRALVNLGRRLQQVAGVQVEWAMAMQERDEVARAGRRKLLLRPKPPKKILTVAEVLAEYGAQAAEVAAFRRGQDGLTPGRHEKPAEKKG